jgi:hypothetical protein
MAGGLLMLIAHVERYLSLRQMLGYKLRNTSGNLRAFARFAAGRGDTHVRISTAMDWATEGTSPYTRHIRLRDAAQLARFLHAEDPTHEVPSNPFRAPKWRPLPYIYTPEEIVQLVGATSRLRESYPLRRQVYATTRALEQCSTRREAVARHFVALATYLGHTDIAHTYWYLEATPELMTDIAAAAEALIGREGL